jgi:uncharacterized circularly permuted ATP-grasp superfamily protein
VIGPSAGPAALALVAQRIEQHPPNWVAQPVLSLSTMPTLCDGVVSPRHVDLRPFTLLGPDGAYVAPGGLTRVARQEGSLIVNSSQGGGSKDTWIVDCDRRDDKLSVRSPRLDAPVSPLSVEWSSGGAPPPDHGPAATFTDQ